MLETNYKKGIFSKSKNRKIYNENTEEIRKLLNKIIIENRSQFPQDNFDVMQNAASLLGGCVFNNDMNPDNLIEIDNDISETLERIKLAARNENFAELFAAIRTLPWKIQDRNNGVRIQRDMQKEIRDSITNITALEHNITSKLEDIESKKKSLFESIKRQSESAPTKQAKINTLKSDLDILARNEVHLKTNLERIREHKLLLSELENTQSSANIYTVLEKQTQVEEFAKEIVRNYEKAVAKIDSSAENTKTLLEVVDQDIQNVVSKADATESTYDRMVREEREAELRKAMAKTASDSKPRSEIFESKSSIIFPDTDE